MCAPLVVPHNRSPKPCPQFAAPVSRLLPSNSPFATPASRSPPSSSFAALQSIVRYHPVCRLPPTNHLFATNPATISVGFQEALRQQNDTSVATIINVEVNKVS
eukprot:Gb_10333 [translate_table: standard]